MSYFAIVLALIALWCWATSTTYRNIRAAWWAEQRRRRSLAAADRRWARAHHRVR